MLPKYFRMQRQHQLFLIQIVRVIVPANPLSAQGLATPYSWLHQMRLPMVPVMRPMPIRVLSSRQPFTILPQARFSIYSPLVIDQGTQPAVVPTAPTLPADAVVGLWFGFNGTNLTLQGAQANTLTNAKCVNGLTGSIFGQFAYCNAVELLSCCQSGIAAGKLRGAPTGNRKRWPDLPHLPRFQRC